MSRLAKKPILIPPEVSVAKTDGIIVAQGPKGKKSLPILSGVIIVVEENAIRLSHVMQDKQSKANLGTMYSLTRNAVQGVSAGFSKTLEIQGVGYRAVLDGKTLVLSLGYVHPVKFDPPEGVIIEVEKNSIRISGYDKEMVGQVAAQIRTLKKPEPYKGKGIRYKGEVILIKAGKKAATGK